MKFWMTVLCALFSENVFAQANEPETTPPAAEATTEATQIQMPQTLEECLTDLQACWEAQRQVGEDANRILDDMAHQRGFASRDDMLADECRRRRGAWQDGKCVCAEPNQWFGENTSDQCCVANVNRHASQVRRCEESDGAFSCRGGCRCPLGTQLLDSRCQGEAETRASIEAMRQRLHELENERNHLQAELGVARTTGEEQAERLAALEDQLAGVNDELNFLRDTLAARDEYIRRLGGTPPSPPTSPPEEPIPESSAAAAAVAAEAARRTEMATASGMPPPAESSEEEDGWYCSRGALEGFVCFGLPVLGATAMALGAACAADWCRDTVITQ